LPDHKNFFIGPVYLQIIKWANELLKGIQNWWEILELLTRKNYSIKISCTLLFLFEKRVLNPPPSLDVGESQSKTVNKLLQPKFS